MPRFNDIPQYTRDGNYGTDVSLNELDEFVGWWTRTHDWEMVPYFQRGHVWDEARQVAYVEHLLRGGKGSNIIRLNCPGWQRRYNGRLQTVDGLQRLTACLRFVRGEIPAFGHYYHEYEDPLALWRVLLRFQVNNLETRAQVLNWYLEINAGGVVHTDEELDRVRALLDREAAGSAA